MPPLSELFRELRETLEALGVRWYLFGAQAAIIYGAARLTADVDVTVDPGEHSSESLINALTRSGFESRVTDPAQFVERTGVLPMVHVGSRIPLDVVFSGHGIEEHFHNRAEEHALDDINMRVVCAADLVAMKILAGRPKDLDDAIAVTAAQLPELDLQLVLGTLQTLQHALGRSDLVSELDEVIRRARRSVPD